MSRKTSDEKAEACRLLLREWVEKSPATFSLDRTAVVPLAIGIKQALLAEGYPSRETNMLLFRYTKSWDYLAAVCAGKPRRNLQGEETGTPTADERKAAHEALVKLCSEKKEKARAAKPMRVQQPEARPTPIPVAKPARAIQSAPRPGIRPILTLKKTAVAGKR